MNKSVMLCVGIPTECLAKEEEKQLGQYTFVSSQVPSYKVVCNNNTDLLSLLRSVFYPLIFPIVLPSIPTSRTRHYVLDVLGTGSCDEMAVPP